MLHSFFTNFRALFPLIGFAVGALSLKLFSRFMPLDRGRDLAFEGDKSKGKRTGVGFVLYIAYFALVVLLAPVQKAKWLYLAAMMLEMVLGHLDDTAHLPWGELKKGLSDLGAAMLVAGAYLWDKGPNFIFSLIPGRPAFSLPLWISFILLCGMVWWSINATNITDGVDGLSSTLAITTVAAILVVYGILKVEGAFFSMGLLLLGVLLSYLWRNCSPSSHLMGDAGSRAMGVMMAALIMNTGDPLLFLLLCLAFIIDGSASLLKLSVRRLTGSRTFMDSVLTPIHDHVRKKSGWTDAQTVSRFWILHVVVCVTTVLILMMN